MTDKEIMQMALDVMLAAIKSGDWKVDGACDPDYVLEALRAALSRPEPEPVADGIQVIEHVRNVQYKIKSRYHLENGTELYTAPPQREWQGLTDEEIRAEWLKVIEPNGGDEIKALARAIEAKLKEKNGF